MQRLAFVEPLEAFNTLSIGQMNQLVNEPESRLAQARVDLVE